MPVSDIFSPLTVLEILAECRNHTFPISRTCRTRSSIIEHIVIGGPSILVESLRLLADTKANQWDVESGQAPSMPHIFETWTHDIDNFIEVPQRDVIQRCYAEFYEATSSAAVRSYVCAVCAGEYYHYEQSSIILPFRDLPHPDRLRPAIRHEAYDLTDGLLLEREGVKVQDGSLFVTLCSTCHAELLKDRHTPPRFSLANNMWLGRIPWALQTLTFPEQLLIALIFPRVFVFKLFPKSINLGADSRSYQRGMRGTLSSYALDQAGIVAMVSGRMLPHLPAILASIISVTVVGRAVLPSHWLKSTFRVRRHCIHQALQWLKANNPKYFGAIDIDNERLFSLPIDDVPAEILSIVRHCEDEEIILQESDGYVPAHDNNDDAPAPHDNDASVIPLQVSGSLDADMTALSSSELTLWGLANLWRQGREGGYHARHSTAPIRDFPDGTDNNYFEKAFPCLFPYGRGGLEAPRVVPVSFNEHIKWCLRYHDRRFRRHETFPFICFAMKQKRQALGTARIQMQWRNFERDARTLTSITADALHEASQQEAQGARITNPDIRLLRRHVTAAAGRVQGADQSRTRLRSQIWSTSIIHGPPSLWLTINPTDLHDPIAQIFAGESIDLDAFMATAGPNSNERAINIAQDPYAASRFFHFMITTVLETLFQVKAPVHTFYSGHGVLGQVSAYFGTVEAQGRGTLHLHMLVWLANSPKPSVLATLFKDPQFRAKLVRYLETTLCAYLPGLESRETLSALPVDKEVAYNRPPNPNSATYEPDIASFELAVTRAEQVHVCKPRRCLFPNKDGVMVCKRHAPFPRSDCYFVHEDGTYGVRRLYGMINTWIPHISINCRCNNDGKFLTNAVETRGISFYVTSYAAKKQSRNHNLSAVMAKAFAYHHTHERPDLIDNLRAQHELFVFRLVNSINREQEFAAPMVISYLMEWGDVYRSHTYSPIYWSSFTQEIMRKFPGVQQRPAIEQDPENNIPANIASTSLTDSDNVDDMPRNVILEINGARMLAVKSQVTDYGLRGDAFGYLNVLDFFVNTYEAAIKHSDVSRDIAATAGRRRHIRAKYLPGHPKEHTFERILRTTSHRNLPNIIGGWLPPKDDEDGHEYYCVSMLTLLKPWRNLVTDLKDDSEDWSAAWAQFLHNATDRIKHIVECLQYYHDCETSGRGTESIANEPAFQETQSDQDGDFQVFEDASGSPGAPCTEEGLAVLLANQFSYKEEYHGRHGVYAGKAAGIFSWSETSWTVPASNQHRSAEAHDMSRLDRWREQMKADVVHMNTASAQDDHSLSDAEVSLLSMPTNHDSVVQHVPYSDEPLDALPATELQPDQRRAYDIVLWHLSQKLAGRSPPPLHMVLHGEGGTGKSKVIQSITAAFEARGVGDLLAKCAYTGVAASLIQGKTTHTMASLSLRSSKTLSAESHAKLQKIWQNKEYVVIDEFSMISKSFLSTLSKQIAIGKATHNQQPSSDPFGGLSVILCGDLHQFPPIGKSIRDALFYPHNPSTDSVEKQVGRAIYEQFTTVVILKQQMRVVDSVWITFLRNLRYGRVEPADLTMLRTLLLNNENQHDDFKTEPWIDAALVTPRHAVRTKWNETMTATVCSLSQTQILVCAAEDTIKGRSLTLAEKYAVAGRGKSDGSRHRTKELPHVVQLAKGMKVMVTNNIETDLDLTNGARGVITDILLHPNEPLHGGQSTARLLFLPSIIFVRLSRTRASTLEGLEPCVIPVEPSITSMLIKVRGVDGTEVSRTVKRRQYPITPAYAFTDYRSQGQTIPYVIVDIARPPSAGLNLFNLYVALSRSSGRHSIRLLRDFEDRDFTQAHDPALLAEDDRLEHLNQETLRWWRRMQADTSL